MPTRDLRMVLLLPLLLLAVDAAPALAQDAFLYEVTETMTLRGIRNPRRIATASLMGWSQSGSPICPASLGVAQCTVNVVATDDIRLDTGLGSVSGNFAVVVQGDNPVDAPELTVLEGTLRGTIDLSPALGSGIPLATVSGRWTAAGVREGPVAGLRSKGNFTGVFRLPFGDPPAYLVGGVPVPLAPGELSLGAATVRLEVDFVE